MSQFYYRPRVLDRIPRAGHSVIEASAGTGKTYTIEHLVLDLVIREKCPIERILVVTFTEKATGELRGRIRALLEKTLVGKTEDSDDCERRELGGPDLRALEEALFSFDRAPVFTIHAFCQRVLSDLAFESGSRFNLKVVDGRGALRTAFRAELREHLAHGPQTRALLDRYLAAAPVTQSAVESMERLLWEAHVHRYLETGAPGQNRIAVEEFVRDFDPAPLRAAYQGLHHATCKVACGALDRIEKEFAAVRHSAAEVFAGMDPAAFDKFPGYQKVAQVLDRNPAARKMHLLVERCVVALALDTRILDSFLPLVEQRLSRDKRERGEIDYEDMLLAVRDALKGESTGALALSLRSRFSFALLDEFQDTDYLQWEIFRRIFVDRQSKCRLFVVGDPKQAIYAFRGADVHAYLAARTALTSGQDAIPLVRNFRSTEALINAVNLIFDEKAKPTLLPKTTPYQHSVRCGRMELRAVNAKGKSIVPVIAMRFRPAGDFRVPPARAAVGRHIAATIRAILDSTHSPIEIRDKGTKPRRVLAHNIFVLTRSKAESAEIGAYLREAGVPFAFYKQDGLFQTSEASDVADVLRAINDPGDRSCQLKAWASPFFGISLGELYKNAEITGENPLLARLYEWYALAEQDRLPELFDAILHQSGLGTRELFLSNSERELTNYQHILEILLVGALEERLSLSEIIERLDSYIQETASPPGINGNLQRTESERSAVQIMSVHLSKGLEADVVFLFGGLRKPQNRAEVCVYHDDGGGRTVLASAAARPGAWDRIELEQDHEERRLLYVAITRARARLYLPYYPGGNLGGFYTPLNDRLDQILAACTDLFEIEQVPPAHGSFARRDEALENRIKTWAPPPALLVNEADKELRTFDAERKLHRAMVIRSYTSLSRNSAREPELEEFKEDANEGQPADLAGGRSVGIFLHEVLEKIDFETIAGAIDLPAWRQREEVRELFERTMRRHGVADSQWFERGSEMIFTVMRSPIPLGGGTTVGPLCSLRSYQREMEFVYPIPEGAHPLLGSDGGADWRAERGYLKGFVDFVFERDGLTYFADWKSDNLDAYDPVSLADHVSANYEMQAKIYSVGVVRLLGIRSRADYEARFGGLMYVFLRAMRIGSPAGHGIYFHRPPWDEIVAYEKELGRIHTWSGAAA